MVKIMENPIKWMIWGPPDWGQCDRRPFGPETFLRMLYANLAFQLQFAQHEEWRRTQETNLRTEDQYGVFGVKTSIRRRSEDKRKGELLEHPNPDSRLRTMALVGTHDDYRAGLVRRSSRSHPSMFVTGSAIWIRVATGYCYVNDLYLVPGVFRDSHANFFDVREQRMEELSETGNPRVLVETVRKDLIAAVSLREACMPSDLLDEAHLP